MDLSYNKFSAEVVLDSGFRCLIFVTDGVETEEGEDAVVLNLIAHVPELGGTLNKEQAYSASITTDDGKRSVDAAEFFKSVPLDEYAQAFEQMILDGAKQVLGEDQTDKSPPVD